MGRVASRDRSPSSPDGHRRGGFDHCPSFEDARGYAAALQEEDGWLVLNGRARGLDFLNETAPPVQHPAYAMSLALDTLQNFIAALAALAAEVDKGRGEGSDKGKKEGKKKEEGGGTQAVAKQKQRRASRASSAQDRLRLLGSGPVPLDALQAMVLVSWMPLLGVLSALLDR